MSLEWLKYENKTETKVDTKIDEAKKQFEIDFVAETKKAEELASKNMENTRKFLENNVNVNLEFGFENKFQKPLSEPTRIINYDKSYLDLVNSEVKQRNDTNWTYPALPNTYYISNYAEKEKQIFAFSLFPDDSDLNEKFSKHLEKIKPADYNKISPLDIILEVAKNSTEDEKIKLAQVVTAYSWEYTYDYDMLDQDTKKPWKAKNISTEEYWKALREWGLTWVCRHIHRAWAEILSWLGMEAGIITVNSWVKHAVTMWKKADWSYFLIDYGKLYEWKSMDKIISDYSTAKWSMDLQTVLSDSKWNIIWKFSTAQQKEYAKHTNVIWNKDSLDYSWDILKKAPKIRKWLNIDSDIKNNSSKVWVSYGFETKEIWAFWAYSKLEDNTTLKTIWIDYKDVSKVKFIWADSYQNIKLSWTEIWFNNWKTKRYATLSMITALKKDIYQSDDLKVSAWASIWGNLNINIDKWEKITPNDWKNDLWSSIRVDKKFTPNLTWYLQWWIWWEVSFKNISWWGLKLYQSNYIEWWVSYRKWSNIYSWKIWQKNSLEWKETYWNIEYSNEKVTAAFYWSHLSRKWNPFLPSETNMKAEVWYNINKNSTIWLTAWMKNDWLKKDYNVWVWYKMTF